MPFIEGQDADKEWAGIAAPAPIGSQDAPLATPHPSRMSLADARREVLTTLDYARVRGRIRNPDELPLAVARLLEEWNTLTLKSASAHWWHPIRRNLHHPANEIRRIVSEVYRLNGRIEGYPAELWFTRVNARRAAEVITLPAAYERLARKARIVDETVADAGSDMAVRIAFLRGAFTVAVQGRAALGFGQRIDVTDVHRSMQEIASNPPSGFDDDGSIRNADARADLARIIGNEFEECLQNVDRWRAMMRAVQAEIDGATSAPRTEIEAVVLEPTSSRSSAPAAGDGTLFLSLPVPTET